MGFYLFIIFQGQFFAGGTRTLEIPMGAKNIFLKVENAVFIGMYYINKKKLPINLIIKYLKLCGKLYLLRVGTARFQFAIIFVVQLIIQVNFLSPFLIHECLCLL